MKYRVNENIVEPFEVKSVIVENENSSIRGWITFSLLLIFSILVISGLILSFKHNNTDLFELLLKTISPFIAIAIGYYFGAQKKVG